MSLSSSQMQSTEMTEVQQHVRFVGGAGVVTKLFGRGIIVNYIGVGLVDLVWTDSQGTFLGVAGFAFSATVPSAVAGYTAVTGDYNTLTRTLRININNNANALTDLIAAQRLTLRPTFKLFNT